MKCNHNIPQARLDLGYKVCVDCSTVEKLGCIDTINHKTGNTIQVMSREDAEKANKLTKRAGFGILRSMANGSSQRKANMITGCSTTFVGNDVMFEQVGKTYMDYLEVDKQLTKCSELVRDRYELRMYYNSSYLISMGFSWYEM